MSSVLVKAVIRRERLPHVLAALKGAGYIGATVYKAEGMGGEGGVIELEGGPVEALIPRVVVEVAVPAEEAQKVMDIIREHSRTGHVGDGRIFVIPLLEVIRIRTGEKL